MNSMEPMGNDMSELLIIWHRIYGNAI